LKADVNIYSEPNHSVQLEGEPEEALSERDQNDGGDEKDDRALIVHQQLMHAGTNQMVIGREEGKMSDAFVVDQG